LEWKIPLFKTYSDQQDIKAVSEIIKRGTYWADGPEVIKFEKKISNYFKIPYTVSFNSGTSALHTLLSTYNIKEKEIIVPSFTFIATCNAVVMAKGIPVFAECEKETFGLDAKDVENKITSKTKAIILVHYAGCPARDTLSIKKIAKKNNILLIEDAAEAFGATINGEKVGTIGDGAIFSFCQSKIISTGEGGAAITNSEKIYEKMKLIRSHGRFEINPGDYFSKTENNDYISLGHNFRIPTMSAALGISQLEKLDKIKDMRIKNAEYLTNNLAKIKEITTPPINKKNIHVYQLYTIQLKDKATRNKLQKYLENKKIMSKIYFAPIHLNTYYKLKFEHKKGDLPITESISDTVLTLPMFPHITKKELDEIIMHIKDFFNEKNIQR
jgi:perosamine synthetase